ncbi:MAG: hypothetical protein ACPW60_07680 [Methylohalobius sp. ZOD2]
MPGDWYRVRAPMQKITDFVLKSSGAVDTAEVINLNSEIREDVP